MTLDNEIIADILLVEKKSVIEKKNNEPAKLLPLAVYPFTLNLFQKSMLLSFPVCISVQSSYSLYFMFGSIHM